MATVDVADLRRLTAVLLAHLEETNGATFELDHDYFWSVPFESVYNVAKAPPELTIGSLVDGAESLSWMVEDDSVLNYGLVWLGELLRAIGGQASE